MKAGDSMAYTIRDATLDDALGIAQVHVTTWKTSYRGLVPDSCVESLSVPLRAERLRKILAARADTRQSVFVAVCEDAQVIGFAATGSQGSAGSPDEIGDPDYDAEILSMYVLPSRQRRGVGTALLRAVATRLMAGGARSAFLWCFVSGPAVPFYEGAGAVRVRTKEASMDGAPVQVAGYAWTDLAQMLR